MTNNTYIDSNQWEWEANKYGSLECVDPHDCGCLATPYLTKDDIIALAKLMGLEVKESE